jgi:hypothetical protein
MSRRWELAAGSAIGVGAGALIYRYLVLGPDWQGPGALVVPAFAISMIVAGVRGVQAMASGARPPVWQRVLAALPGLALGFALAYVFLPPAARVALHDRTIGALTLALPDGDVRETPAMLAIDHVGGVDSSVGVVSRVAAYEPATVDAMIRGASQGLGGGIDPSGDDLPVGDGLPHRGAILRNGDVRGRITVFACGDRVFGVLAIGDGAEALERRMLASVRCAAAATPAPP